MQTNTGHKKTVLQTLLIYMGGLIAVLGIGITFALSYIDWNAYRADLALLASQQVGIDVHLDGNISVQLLPRPTFTAEKVRLHPAGSSSDDLQLASADNLYIRLGFLDLLQGQLQIQRLELDGFELKIRQNVDGDWLAEGWPQHRDTGEPSETSATYSSVILDRLHLKRSRISVVPFQQDPIVLNDVSLDLKGQVPDGPLEWNASFELAEEKYETNGQIRKIESRNEHALRMKIITPGGTLKLSGHGKLGQQGQAKYTGRLEAFGNDIARFVTSFSKFMPNPIRITDIQQPFRIDTQFHNNSGLIQLIGRSVTLGGTRGQINVTISPDTRSVTGMIALGIVDAAAWQNMRLLPQGQKLQSQDSSVPFSGGIDISVEGIRVKDGLVQKLDASLSFLQEGINLSHAQALFPGATTVSLTGLYDNVGHFTGRSHMQSGSMKDFLRWLGIDINDDLALGRLATADFRASFGIDNTAWVFSDLTGAIDTTEISGTISGAFDQAREDSNSLSIQQVDLHLGQLNLDAYMPAVQGLSAMSGRQKKPSNILDDFELMLPDAPADVRLFADRIFWGQNRFNKASLQASIGPDGVSLSHFRIDHKDGHIDTTGYLTKSGDDWIIDGRLNLEKWRLPFLKHGMPELTPYFSAAKAQAVTGEVSLTGPLDNLRLALIANHDQGSLKLGGTAVIDMKDGVLLPTSYTLQGRVQHGDIAHLLDYIIGRGQGQTPQQPRFQSEMAVDINVSIQKNMDQEQSQITANGEFAGGQISFDVTVPHPDLEMVSDGSETRTEYRVSYDHTQISDVFSTFTVPIKVPQSNDNLSLSFEGSLTQKQVNVKALDIRSGKARIAGSGVLKLKADAPGAYDVIGDVQIANFNLDAYLNHVPERPAIIKKPSLSTFWARSSGSLNLNLQNLILMGHETVIPNATLIMGDQSVRISLGDEARLGSGTLAGHVNILAENQNFGDVQELGNGHSPHIQSNLQVSRIDISKALEATKYPPFFTGEAKVDMTVSADTADIETALRTLNGEVSLDAWAGSLEFMAVQDVVKTIQNSTSPGAFLRNISASLRGGKTAYSDLSAALTFDTGVALVEAFEAKGAWGALTLDGQLNFPSDIMTLKGDIDLAEPIDAPSVPLKIQGPLQYPIRSFDSRQLERFVTSQIEHRLRSALYKNQEAIAASGEAALDPAAAVFTKAFDLLEKLREKQLIARREAIEAAREKAELTDQNNKQ